MTTPGVNEHRQYFTCSSCGYDGAADGTVTTCPKCGDEASRDACTGCGYHLHGMHDEDACPECGQPAGLSRGGRGLSRADPRWCRTIARGALLTGIGLSVLLIVSTLSSAVLGFISSSQGNSAALIQRLSVLNGALATLLSAIYVIGLWMFTTPDPGDARATNQFSARFIARLGAVLSMMVVPLLVVSNSPYIPVPMGPQAGVLLLGYALTLVTSTAGWIALAFYSRPIAHRAGVGVTSLALFGTLLVYGVITLVSTVFGASLIFSGFAPGQQPMTIRMMIISIAGCGAASLSIGVGMLLSALFIRLGVRLRHCAREAQKHRDDHMSRLARGG